MVQYRRNFIPGGTYFFTVTLADRTSSALVDNMDALLMAFVSRGTSVFSRSTPL
jgi:putative transposase